MQCRALQVSSINNRWQWEFPIPCRIGLQAECFLLFHTLVSQIQYILTSWDLTTAQLVGRHLPQVLSPRAPLPRAFLGITHQVLGFLHSLRRKLPPNHSRTPPKIWRFRARWAERNRYLQRARHQCSVWVLNQVRERSILRG